MRPTTMRPRRLTQVALTAALALALLSTESAQATLPGKNGRMAYTSIADCEESCCYNLWTSEPDGHDRRLHASEVVGDGLDFEPVFSPNGRLLATALSFGGNRGIHLTADEGAAFLPRRRALQLTSGADTSPAWSADGKTLIYVRVSGREGRARIRMVTKRGRDLGGVGPN
jgi:Tol biopolymer transport system component